MANNPYVNKVVYGNNTLIDLTGITVTPATLLAGVTAINASGQLITGEMQGMGTKVSGTVSGSTLSFTNSAIKSNSIIDGPYIADVLTGIDTVSQNGTTITFVLENDSANGKTAYIWVRE